MEDPNIKINVIDRFKEVSIPEIKKTVNADALPYDVMIMNIRDPRNAGNVIRTCNLCGVRRVVVFGRKKFDKTGSVGAHHYTEVERVCAIPNSDFLNFETLRMEEADQIIDETIFIEYIKHNNYIPIFIEQTDDAMPATSKNIKEILTEATKLSKIPVFILGNESFGIPMNILGTRTLFPQSHVLQLKQLGCIRSHNVANCCAILCYKIMEEMTD